MSSYAYIVLDLLSSSPESLEEGNKVFADKLPELFDLREDEEVVMLRMPEWEKRAELYPNEPFGPGSSAVEAEREEDEDAGPVSAVRYKFYVTTHGDAGIPSLDDLLEVSESLEGVRIVMAYLYYWVDDIGMVGYADIIDGSLDDEESQMFTDDADYFISLSRTWLGWEFPPDVADVNAEID
jgi:hypothetical protein